MGQSAIYPRLSAWRGRLHRALRYWKAHGLVATTRHAVRRLAEPAARPPRTDWVGHYRFVRPDPFGAALEALAPIPRNTVNWVIPDVGTGSGGHLNIFRLIHYLEKQGTRHCIAIHRGSYLPGADAARELIRRHYLPLEARVVIGERNMPPAWVTFATAWETAYAVRDFRSTVHRCYFVQDFEPAFFPAGTSYVLAEQTYRFGFLGVTAGRWLAEKLAREYAMRTIPIGFSYDKARYRPLPRGPREGGPRVFFYARDFTQRRAFELGLLVFDELSRRLPGLHVVLAGCDVSPYAIPFAHTNVGLAPFDDLPAIYASCDAALVISLTNLSLLPLDLMACGCPVVSNTGPNVQWLLGEDNAALAPPTVEALSAALYRVLTDAQYRARLVEGGLRLAQSTDWEREARQVGRVLEGLAATDRPGAAAP